MNPKMRMDDAAKAKMRQHVLAKTWEGIQLVFPIPTSDQGPAALRWKSWACVRNACKTYPIKTQWQRAARLQGARAIGSATNGTPPTKTPPGPRTRGCGRSSFKGFNHEHNICR